MRKCRKIFALLLPVLCFAASGAVWAAPYDGSSALSSGEIRYDETNRTLQGTVMFSFNPAEFYGTSVLARLTANSGEGEKAEYYYLRLNKRLSETELELTDSDGKAVTVATVFAVSQDSRGCTVKFLNIHSDDFTLEFSDGTTHFSDACKVNLRNKSLVITVSEAVSDRISVKIDGRVFENDYSVFGQPDEHLSLTESGEKAPESSWAESAGEVKSAADSLAANGESRALGTVSQPGAKKSGGFTVVLICIVLILSAVVVVLVMQHLKNKKVKINKPALNGGTPVDGPPRTEFGSPEIEPPVDWRHNKEKKKPYVSPEIVLPNCEETIVGTEEIITETMNRGYRGEYFENLNIPWNHTLLSVQNRTQLNYKLADEIVYGAGKTQRRYILFTDSMLFFPYPNLLRAERCRLEAWLNWDFAEKAFNITCDGQNLTFAQAENRPIKKILPAKLKKTGSGYIVEEKGEIRL